MNKLILGIVVLVIGIAVTIGSYMMAPEGGHYVIMTGLIAVGLGLTIRGIIDVARGGTATSATTLANGHTGNAFEQAPPRQRLLSPGDLLCRR